MEHLNTTGTAVIDTSGFRAMTVDLSVCAYPNYAQTAVVPAVRTVKLLEFNRVPYHPWLTPSLCEQEMAVQQFEESNPVRMHDET